MSFFDLNETYKIVSNGLKLFRNSLRLYLYWSSQRDSEVT